MTYNELVNNMDKSGKNEVYIDFVKVLSEYFDLSCIEIPDTEKDKLKAYYYTEHLSVPRFKIDNIDIYDNGTSILFLDNVPVAVVTIYNFKCYFKWFTNCKLLVYKFLLAFVSIDVSIDYNDETDINKVIPNGYKIMFVDKFIPEKHKTCYHNNEIMKIDTDRFKLNPSYYNYQNALPVIIDNYYTELPIDDLEFPYITK